METPSHIPDDLGERVAFRTTLVENVAAVVDALDAMRDEVAAAGEPATARLFDRLAGVLRHFLTGWLLGQATHEATLVTSSRRRARSDGEH